MSPSPTDRTTLKRFPKRGSHDAEVIHRILDEALVCHVGFTADDQPFVIPSSFGRAGNAIYLHGAAASRMMRTLAAGARVCVTVTLLDGLVLARGAASHSMNYRSVVIVGRAVPVVEGAEKVAALRAIIEHVVPGRWNEIRPPNQRELDGTAVVRLSLDESSAKIRSGPPVDSEPDLALPVWAGVLPLPVTPGVPQPDTSTGPGREVPRYVKAYARR